MFGTLYFYYLLYLYPESTNCTSTLQLYKSTNFNIKVANKHFSVIENLCCFMHLRKEFAELEFVEVMEIFEAVGMIIKYAIDLQIGGTKVLSSVFKFQEALI